MDPVEQLKTFSIKENLSDNIEYLMDCITNHTEPLLEWLSIPQSHKFIDYIPHQVPTHHKIFQEHLKLSSQNISYFNLLM